MNEQFSCKLCNSSSIPRSFSIREMMFGLRENFEYLQCSDCGSMQLAQLPADMSKYYPKSYYSYSAPPAREPYWKKTLRYYRTTYALGKKTILGRLLTPVMQPRPIPAWLQDLRINLADAILDVGCGSGHLLQELSLLGFTNLTGVDPYVEQSIETPEYRVQKCTIDQLTGNYDLVMFHHSFEHLADPARELRTAVGLCKPEGCILIRLPITEKFAWREFGVNWVALDAPRHCFIPTVKGMQALAEQIGMKVEKIVYDSTALQFWGSLQYQQDIPLRSEKSFAENPTKSIFSTEKIQEFRQRAKQLNVASDGDQGCFIMRKPS